MEIAIAGYEVVATVFTQEAFPEQWATTQNNLGLVYNNRIREDRVQNLELAIECYKQALAVRTRNDFPVDWAITQKTDSSHQTGKQEGSEGSDRTPSK